MPGLVSEWIVSAFAVATAFVVMFNLGLELNPRDFVHAWGRPALMPKALLFYVGYRFAKDTMARPVLTALVVLLVGVALVARAIALGG